MYTSVEINNSILKQLKKCFSDRRKEIKCKNPFHLKNQLGTNDIFASGGKI